jgi:hypothetical protein
LLDVTYARFARPGASLPTSAARSMLAGEPLPIPSGRRSREITQTLWPAEQTLVARASCEKDRADIDAGGLATVDRRLDFTPNPALSLRVRLPSNRDSTIGLVAEGLPRLLPRRGETTGQAVEIVAIVQVFWSGVSDGPKVASLALELLSLRGRHQPKIVFGVLEIVLRGDRVAGCVSVARQLKVSLRHMRRRAANSDVEPARVI